MGVARAAFALLFLSFASCGGSSSAQNPFAQPTSAVLFSPSITNVVVEVDYQAGAPPYTSAIKGLGDPWNLFRTNATRLFQATNKTLTVPSTLDQMTEVTDVTGSSFTADQILAIANTHRQQKNTGSTATFYVLFLAGYYQDTAGVERDVLGVSIADSGVVALFKPVIEATGAGPRNQVGDKYVEQSTLVHEFGHAVGLVNDGVPLAAQHEDPTHPNHCTNQKCVLYWENDGAVAALAFVRQYVTTGNEILYGAECLADVDALAKGAK